MATISSLKDSERARDEGFAGGSSFSSFSTPRLISLVLGSAGSITLIVLGAIRLRDHSLLRGPFPVLFVVSAYLTLALSLWNRSMSWWRKTMPIIGGAAAAVTLTAAIALHATRTVVDTYPHSFLLWAALAFISLFCIPFGFKHLSWERRVARLLAVPLTFASGFVLVNLHYGYWPTVGSLLGRHVEGTISAQQFKSEVEHSAAPVLIQQSHSSVPLGQVAPFDPPALVSHFPHRVGGIYLPPAFFSKHHPSLPVIVMLGGVPGGPYAWEDAGFAVATANQFAAENNGVAPILVFADQNGSALGDSECVDGPRGNADTYISVDVPNYISQELHIPLNPKRFVIAGFSEGGTCAITQALRHPNVWGHFVDLAGDLAPNVGSHQFSLKNLYGGSIKRMADYYPTRLMRIRRYDGMTAWFASGSMDPLHLKLMADQASQAQAAGIAARNFIFKGEGHSWQFAAESFRQILPALSHQLQIY
ncbi:MAG: alpha/beta hydrolase [Actinomycetota bacterium]